MIRSTAWFPIGVLALLVVLTFWLNNRIQPSGIKNDGSTRHDPDLIVENFTARKLGPDGNVRYTLVATRMVHYPDDDSSVLDKVSFEGVNPGQPRVVATSDHGQLLEGTDKVIMEGNVVINSEATSASPAWTLSTPRLTLQPDDNLAHSESGVTIRDVNGGVISAESFVMNTETRVVTMHQINATMEKTRP